jgi:hypothetical protein
LRIQELKNPAGYAAGFAIMDRFKTIAG